VVPFIPNCRWLGGKALALAEEKKGVSFQIENTDKANGVLVFTREKGGICVNGVEKNPSTWGRLHPGWENQQNLYPTKGPAFRKRRGLPVIPGNRERRLLILERRGKRTSAGH